MAGMSTERILEAARVLELGEKASLKEIKDAYSRLLYRWHPDRCREDPEICGDMTKKIIDAYGVIKEYCQSYRFPFTGEKLREDMEFEDPGEFWKRRFGNDPYWG